MRSLRRFTVLCGLRAAAFKCLGQSEYIQVALTTLYELQVLSELVYNYLVDTMLQARH